MFALQIQAVKDRDEKVTAYRAIIFEREAYEGGYVCSIHDVLEADTLEYLQGFFCHEYVDRDKVTYAVTEKWTDGTDWEAPDEISVWEAAECVAAFPVDLFNQDPLGKN